MKYSIDYKTLIELLISVSLILSVIYFLTDSFKLTYPYIFLISLLFIIIKYFKQKNFHSNNKIIIHLKKDRFK